MADYKTDYSINYQTNAAQAESEIANLREQIASLQAEVDKLQQASQKNDGFVISPEQAAATVERLGNIQVGLGNLNLSYTNIDQSVGNSNNDWKIQTILWDELFQRIPHLLDYAEVLGKIAIGAAGVGTAFSNWDKIVSLSANVASTATSLATQISTSLEKASIRVGQFVTDYLGLSKISAAAGLAADVIALKQVADTSINASNAVKEMTLSMGNLSKNFTDFDKNTYILEDAKRKYGLLNDATLVLGQTTDQLYSQFKTLFEALKSTSTTAETRIKDSNRFACCNAESPRHQRRI